MGLLDKLKSKLDEIKEAAKLAGGALWKATPFGQAAEIGKGIAGAIDALTGGEEPLREARS